MPVLTPLGVLLGLLFYGVFMPFKETVTWLFAFLTLVNGMGVSVKDFGSIIRHPRPVAVFLLCSYILLPVSATFVSKLIFSSSQETILGFALLYSIPTAVVACIWSGIYGGNGALSLTVLVIGTLLAPIATPLSVRLLAASEITIDTKGMMISLLMMVVIPSLIGIALNFITKGRCTDHAVPCLKPFTKLALLLVITVNTSQVAEELISSASPAYIPDFAAAFIFTVLGFIIARLVSRLFSLNREDTVSVTFASGMRNISAAMVIAISFFPPQSVLPVISGIVLQQSAVAIASHFLFGRKPGKDNMNTVKERT